MTTQPHQKQHMLMSRRPFLLKNETPFHLYRKKLDYLHPKDFLKYECELYLQQPLTPP